MSSGTWPERAAPPGGPLGEGERVVVRPAERIRGTLDALGRRDGIFFMPQMYSYCGKEFRVRKVVRNAFDEGKLRMNVLESPVYILEGIVCDGRVDAFRDACDKCCCIFWHRDWLERG